MKITKRPIDKVYHYCSVEAFFSIVKNKTLRLSQIVKSNDSTEITWITRYIDKTFEEEYEKAKGTNQLKKVFTEHDFLKKVSVFTEKYFNESNQKFENYAICFCSDDGDRLSQWRGYGDDGRGVALGFNNARLIGTNNSKANSCFKVPELRYDSIVYTEKFQVAKIREVAQSLIEDLKKIAKENVEANVLAESDIKRVFKNCFEHLYKLGVIMKSAFFKEEHEWRLWFTEESDVADSSGWTQQDVGNGFEIINKDFSVRNGRIVSHLDLSFKGVEAPFIQDVVIGPKSAMDVKEVKDYLAYHNINIDNENVRLSSGSYR